MGQGGRDDDEDEEEERGAVGGVRDTPQSSVRIITKITFLTHVTLSMIFFKLGVKHSYKRERFNRCVLQAQFCSKLIFSQRKENKKI
jgi:hypothetical protein